MTTTNELPRVDVDAKTITYPCGCWERVESIERTGRGSLVLGDQIEIGFCGEHEPPAEEDDL